MKRILALLGSPRPGGNSETLTQAVLRGAGSKGNEISEIRLNGMTLGGCIDCRKCWSRGNPCIIVDDMNGIHDRIRQADIIVFSTPLYWYTWSSQIKPVWDRFLPFLHENAAWDLRGKEAMLVATAGDDRADAFEGLLFSFRTSCDLLGIQQVEPLLACGVHEKGDILKGDWVKKAEERGRAL
jgi:multimeric flavodoxin WrbA